MKKNLKILLAWILVLTMLLGMAACGNQNAPEQAAPESTDSEQVKVNTGKCTDLGTPLADLRVRQALLAANSVKML